MRCESRESAGGEYRACAVSRRSTNSPVFGGARVCFAESISYSPAVFELSLEFLPFATQTMASEDFLQPSEIDGARLDELQHACLVFGPASVQRNSGNV